ncbi:MAG: PD-(D/E)XK nuclease domain-containing protein, partial [Bacteroidales bacterium]|nr:PD-(D/E)XK nuclease domain-containing protein [Bacteroidales bacterium]
ASPEKFLYQSGYLTLREGTTDDYSLDYPNTEVLNSMARLLTSNIVGNENYGNYSSNIRKHLLNKNKDGFKDVLNMLLSKIPYDDYTKAAQQVIQNEDYKFPAQEWLYRSTILSFLQGCGVVVEAELHTFKGRPDLVISYRDSTFIIEIKVAFKTDNVEAKLTEAATQIREKEYIKPYPNAICLAMVIDDTQRQIVKCEEV